MTALNQDLSVRRPVLLVTTLGAFLIAFTGSSINIALPSMGKEFGMDAVLLGWVTSSYLLTLAILQIPFGRIADICGRKRLFLYGSVIYAFASLVAGLAASPFFLILMRVVQGIGGAMIFTTALAIVTTIFPPEERGKVLGINVAAVYGGLSSGPFFGGLLTHALGWRSVFLINLPLGLPVILLTLWKVKGDWTEAKGEAFDFPGALIYSTALVSLMIGLPRLPAVEGICLIGLGILGFVIFGKWETHSKSPMFRVDLFRKNKSFAFSNLAALIHYSATFAVTFLLSLYLQFIKGYNPQQAGLILVSQPIVQTICSPFAGRLSDRMEPQLVASIGMAISAAGLLLFAFLGEGTGVILIIGNLVLLGFGFALFSSPNTNAVMGSVERRFYGVASGILGTMRTMGMSFSMGTTMLIFSLLMGRTQITPALYPLFIRSARIAFVLFTVLCLAGVFASLRGDRR
jgi:EmrB/QacA subfamily drug resistance transporter